MRWMMVFGLVLFLMAGCAAKKLEHRVTGVPESEVKRLGLSLFYKKYVSVGGFPIVSSEKVSDFALLEAAYLIEKMIGHDEKLRRALIASGTRFVVMAYNEYTSDVPEHSDLQPNKWWDYRARGLGATRWRPAVSCGEENLLRYYGDPYRAENILIHEFAHAIHHMGLDRIRPGFDVKLELAYEAAMRKGLWKGKYAASNRAEYWAEAVQSWFDTNRKPDHDHNHVDTRKELIEYDPGVAKLVEEVFGKPVWKYVNPSERNGKGVAHLKGFDLEKAPRFTWPKGLRAWYQQYEKEKAERRRNRNGRGE